MTLKEINDALAKGQGRAILHLRSVDPAPYFHSVRRAVLRWQGFFAQQEEKRGDYLVDLINASSDPLQLKLLTIRHLARRKGYWGHRAQKRDICRSLAVQGSVEARQALYDAFEASDVDADDAIIAVDGLVGLEWLLVNSVDKLEIEPSKRDGWVFWLAHELGEDVVRAHLLASEEAGVRQAAEYIDRKFKNRRESPRSPSGLSSFADVKRQWVEKSSSNWFWKWGMEASSEGLAEAASEFETSEDADFLRALTKVFVKVEHYPGNHKRVVERATAWPAGDYWNPFTAILGEWQSPELRDLGLSFLAQERVAEALDLLRLNAVPDDGQAIVNGLGKVSLAEKRIMHSIGLDCLHVAALLEDVDAVLVLGWMLEHAPCSFCRNSAFRDMTDRGLATPAMVAEAMWDCDPDTRQLARGVSPINPLPTDLSA